MSTHRQHKIVVKNDEYSNVAQYEYTSRYKKAGEDGAKAMKMLLLSAQKPLCVQGEYTKVDVSLHLRKSTDLQVINTRQIDVIGDA